MAYERWCVLRVVAANGSLENAEVDIALLYLPDAAALRFATEPVLEESLYLVGPPGMLRWTCTRPSR